MCDIKMWPKQESVVTERGLESLSLTTLHGANKCLSSRVAQNAVRLH